MKLPKKLKSEKHALEVSLKIWEFLKDNPNKNKSDLNKNIYALYSCGCPLCAYYNFDCNRCCLRSKTLCKREEVDSAYAKWSNNLTYIGKEKIIQKSATKIYNAIKKALDNYEEKK